MYTRFSRWTKCDDLSHYNNSPSGLTCYTCNKLFTNRDLIENHYKTVRHHLECKKIRQMEQVEMTNPEEETKKYRKLLILKHQNTDQELGMKRKQRRFLWRVKKP